MKHPLISRLFLSAALLFAGAAAFAHDDATLDKMKAPNGGQLRMAGPYHFELLVDKNNKEAKDSPVTVYLTDHGEKKIPAAGVSGIVSIVFPDKKTEQARFSPLAAEHAEEHKH